MAEVYLALIQSEQQKHSRVRLRSGQVSIDRENVGCVGSNASGPKAIDGTASYSETHDGRLLTQITTSGRSFPAPTRSTAPFPMAEGGL